MKLIINFFILFLLSMALPARVLAVVVTINSSPSTISSLDPFGVTVGVSGATNATNYLRVDLYKDGTSNYFGETYNGSDWYGGSDGKSYFPIQIQNSSASASLQAQIGNPSVGDYPGPGVYKLKIRRYTSSGSQSSNDAQTPVDVQITYATPTPTPTPTAAPTSAPTANPTAIPTPTPTPTKTPTPIPKTPSPSPTPSPTPTSEVLGLRNEITSPSTTPIAMIEAERSFPIFPAFLIVGGLSCIGFAGFSLFRKVKSEYNSSDEHKDDI